MAGTDLEMIDRRLYTAQITALDSATAEANYESIEQAINKVRAAI